MSNISESSSALPRYIPLLKHSNVLQVRNSYDFHLNEIFATVQNEYSDWSSDNSDFIREVVFANSMDLVHSRNLSYMLILI